ncbi:hypothetical protein [Streptomyces noursei]
MFTDLGDEGHVVVVDPSEACFLGVDFVDVPLMRISDFGSDRACVIVMAG